MAMEVRSLPKEPGVSVRKIRSPAGFDAWLVGGTAEPLGDFYHAFLRLSWPSALAVLGGAYLVANLLFAGVFLLTGGVANARPGSFLDAFGFSVQTLATIGYGAMYPASPVAHVVVVLESLVGLLFTALSTGLVFARFTRIVSRVRFTSQAVVSPMDGVPTLSFRLGNDRNGTVFNARISVTLSRTEVTREGVTFYRNYDLRLVRDHNDQLTRSWSVMHRIDEASPLYQAAPATIEAQEVELGVFLHGVDDTTHQPVFAYQRYDTKDILFAHRHKDILATAPDGTLIVDLRRFDEVESVPA